MGPSLSDTLTGATAMAETPPLILLVDDEAHILYVVGLKFEEAGYRVISAPDGKEGLRIAQAEKPDVIITDYQMPFLTGLELAKQLQQNPATNQIPVLMLTARGFSLPPDALDSGVTAIMTKPFSPREILAHVGQLLHHRPPQIPDVA